MLFLRLFINFSFLHLKWCEVSMETVQPIFSALDCLPTQVKTQAVLDASSIYGALNTR